MIGLGSPVLGLKPVSYVCHQEAAVIRHVIRGWVKKKKVLERTCFRLGKDRRAGGRGEKAFSIDEYFFIRVTRNLSSAIDESSVFFREKEFEQNFRFTRETTLYMTVLSEYWKELIFFYGNFNTMFYTGKRCLITIKYAECVTNLAPHLYNRGNYY